MEHWSTHTIGISYFHLNTGLQSNHCVINRQLNLDVNANIAGMRWHSIEIQFVGIIVSKQEQNVNKTDTLSKVCMRCHFFFFSLFTLCHCFRFRALPVFHIVSLIYCIFVFSICYHRHHRLVIS